MRKIRFIQSRHSGLGVVLALAVLQLTLGRPQPAAAAAGDIIADVDATLPVPPSE